MRVDVALRGLAICLSLSATVASAAPRADALEMEDRERAELAKEMAKQKRDGADAQSKGKKSSGCGNVDIGNETEKRGSSRIGEKSKTVIVTGNVYNTANCKR